jgi:hypothetical protein
VRNREMLPVGTVNERIGLISIIDSNLAIKNCAKAILEQHSGSLLGWCFPTPDRLMIRKSRKSDRCSGNLTFATRPAYPDNSDSFERVDPKKSSPPDHVPLTLQELRPPASCIREINRNSMMRQIVRDVPNGSFPVNSRISGQTHKN